MVASPRRCRLGRIRSPGVPGRRGLAGDRRSGASGCCDRPVTGSIRGCRRCSGVGLRAPWTIRSGWSATGTAVEDADRAAADGGFDPDLVAQAGWDPSLAVLSDLGEVGLRRCGHLITLGRQRARGHHDREGSGQRAHWPVVLAGIEISTGATAGDGPVVGVVRREPMGRRATPFGPDMVTAARWPRRVPWCHVRRCLRAGAQPISRPTVACTAAIALARVVMPPIAASTALKPFSILSRLIRRLLRAVSILLAAF